MTSIQPEPAVREEFYQAAARLPETEAEWKSRQDLFRSWRAEARFEPYWPLLDQMLTVEFAALRRWATAAEAVRGLADYDFAAWRDQREFDRLHVGDQRP